MSTGPNWDETRRYEFDAAEVTELYRAAEDCQAILLDALDVVMTHGDDAALVQYGIPAHLIPAARMSWRDGWPLLTTRMDFSYDGTRPAQLLELNADTAMMGVETAVALPQWLADVAPGHDQANQLHAAAVATFEDMRGYLRAPMWFLSARTGDDEAEALLNATWLRTAADEAGIDTRQAFLEDLRFNGSRFTYQGEPVDAAYKQYIYRYIAGTPAERNLAAALAGDDPAFWLNAPYTAALGAKALLAIAWQLYEKHPNLLPTYAGTPGNLTDFARKPLTSHDSMGVTLHENGQVIAGLVEDADDRNFIFQQLAPLPDLGGGRAVVSVWLVGTRAAAIAIRDSDGPLTYGDHCRFVPHLITDQA